MRRMRRGEGAKVDEAEVEEAEEVREVKVGTEVPVLIAMEKRMIIGEDRISERSPFRPTLCQI